MIASRARSAHLSRRRGSAPGHVTRRWTRSGFFLLILHPGTVRSSSPSRAVALGGCCQMLIRFSRYINVPLGLKRGKPFRGARHLAPVPLDDTTDWYPMDLRKRWRYRTAHEHGRRSTQCRPNATGRAVLLCACASDFGGVSWKTVDGSTDGES